MKYLTYGNQKNPVILMLHGNLTNARTCFQTLVPLLEEDYYLVIPCIDGFSNDASTFTTVEAMTAKIEKFVNRKFPNGIFAVYGLSLGGTLTVNLLARGKVKIEKAFIDAAFCIDMREKALFWTSVFVVLSQFIRFILSFPKLKNRICEAIPPACALCTGYTIKTEINVCKSVYHYAIPQSISNCESNVMFIFGSLEKYPQQSALIMKGYLPDLTFREIADSNHAQYLLTKPGQYAADMKIFFSKA